MLLDCWSIPCVIVLTWIFLETKYGLRKFIGVGVCVAGLILVVFSDVHASDRASKNILPPIKMFYNYTPRFQTVFP
jgi:drug/metabolite transporter (DMT)-like permease